MNADQIVSACEALLGRGRKPTVPEVAPLAGAYYLLQGNSCGGSLHLVLDDGNVEDAHVRFCIEWAEKDGRTDRAGAALGRVLLMMSKTQRLRLFAQR